MLSCPKSLAFYYKINYNSQELLYYLYNINLNITDMEITVKKFSALLICLLMIITCGLAGCASFSIDKVKYYNEVLATVDETKITRFDLLNAYNSYGNSYYVQQMGKSESEALTSTLDLLINREALYQYALDNNETYKPTAYQVNEVIKEMFDSMDEQMESYVKTAKKILNIKVEESEEEEDKEEETTYKLEDYKYSPRAEVKFTEKERTVYYTDSNYTETTDETTQFSKTEKYNDYYIQYLDPKDKTIFEELIDNEYLTNFTSKETVNQIQTNYFKHLEDELTLTENENATKILDKVKTLFAKDLINYEYYLRNENGKKYDTISENLFNRYFTRTFENNIKSQYLENIRIHYLKNEELDINLLKEEYQYLATMNYNLYDKNHKAYQNKMKDIGTAGDTVLYHPETDAQFGYFIHTLISFDSIEDNLSKLENYTGDDKDEIYKNIVTSLTLKARNLETGLVPDNAKEESITDVLAKYEAIRTGTYSSEKARMAAFVEFMFEYTGDTATLKQGMPYVVGTDGYSAMVEEFNNEAIMLMTGKNKKGEKVMDAKVGNMSVVDLEDLNNMCITEYGLHLIYYVGNVNAFDIPYGDTSKVYIETESREGEEMYNLFKKVINPLTQETYFDMMFDKVYPASSGEVYTSNTGYSDYEEQLNELSKKKHPVTKYTSKIKATKTSL